jgi:hypothetical protein
MCHVCVLWLQVDRWSLSCLRVVRHVGVGRSEAAQAPAYLQCHRVPQLQGNHNTTQHTTPYKNRNRHDTVSIHDAHRWRTGEVLRVMRRVSVSHQFWAGEGVVVTPARWCRNVGFNKRPRGIKCVSAYGQCSLCFAVPVFVLCVVGCAEAVCQEGPGEVGHRQGQREEGAHHTRS